MLTDMASKKACVREKYNGSAANSTWQSLILRVRVATNFYRRPEYLHVSIVRGEREREGFEVDMN